MSAPLSPSPVTQRRTPVQNFVGAFDRGIRAPKSNYSNSRIMTFAREAELVSGYMQQQPNALRNISLQKRSRNSYDPASYAAAQDAYTLAKNVSGDKYAAFRDRLWRILPHFESIVANERQSIGFYNGHIWTPDMIEDITSAGLGPSRSNRTSRFVRVLCGQQVGSKTMYSVTPTTDEQKDAADFWEQCLNAFAEANEWNYSQNDFFFNYAVGGRAFSSVRTDPYDQLGRVLMRVHKSGEFFYDLDNAKNGMLDGSMWMGRVYRRDLEEVINEYPLWDDVLRDMPQDMSPEFYFTLNEPRVQAPVMSGGKRRYQQMSVLNQWQSQSRRSVFIQEFYERSTVQKVSVRDAVWHIDRDFEGLEQAVDFYRNLRDAYEALVIAETGQPPRVSPVMAPRNVLRPTIEQAVFAGKQLLDMQSWESEFYPYQCSHNEWNNGEFRGYFDDDKDNTVLASQALVGMGLAFQGLKDKQIVDMDVFPQGTTPQDVERNMVRPTKILTVKGKTNQGTMPLGNFFHTIKSPDNLKIVEMILNFTQQQSAFINGGQNAIGEAEFAGQSARLGRQLTEQANVGEQGVFANYTRWDIRVAKALADVAQHVDATALLEWTSPKDQDRFAQVLQAGVESASSRSFRLEITEVQAGPNKLARQRAELNEMASQSESLARATAPMRLKKSELSKTEIEEIEQNLQQEIEAERAQTDRELKIQEFDAHMKWGLAEEDRDIKWAEVDVKKHPGITKSVAVKVDNLGPRFVASAMEDAGMSADPEMIVQDRIDHATIEQDVTNMTQENFDKRDIEKQKRLAPIQMRIAKAGAAAKKPAAKKSGVSSPKDRSARQRKGPERT